MMKIAIAVMLFLGGPAGLAASPLDDGLKLAGEGKYSEAIPLLEREMRANPGSPNVLLNLGWAYWHEKRFDDAWGIGKTLVQLAPENPAFLVFLANTDVERKDYEGGAELARKALALEPGRKDASLVLARALFRLQQAGEAMGIVDGILAKDPGHADALFRKAGFLAELGRKEEALSCFEKLVKADPRNPDYRKARAKALRALGRSAEAKAEWKSLVKSQPDGDSLLNLGWMYSEEKDYEEAARIGALLVKLDGENPTFLRFMANMEIERLHFDAALRLSEKALKLAPGDRDASLVMARSLFNLQREKEGIAVLKRLIREYPDHPAVMYHWADCSMRMGDYNEALTYYDKLLKIDPAKTAYRLNRASVLYEMGRFREAEHEWRTLVERKEPDPEALKRLRDDAFNRKAWDEALKWQDVMADLEPTNPAVWETLANIYDAKGDTARALDAADKAIEMDPLSVGGFYRKAETYEGIHDPAAAERAYKDILSRNPNSIRAMDGLSYALEEQGDYRAAIAVVHKMIKVSPQPTPANLFLHEARLLADNGNLRKARGILGSMTRTRKTMLPALLYHGVSRFDRTESIPVEEFKEQMAALKAQGYEAITVEELDRYYRGKGNLPVKPILITFDDARTDAFENASPVLQAQGFKATMFTHMTELRRWHFHAPMDEIRRWQATGLWDIQAHGYHAHDPMVIDAFKRKGHFLANRLWLPAEKRLETLAEYRSRVDDEYREAKRRLEEFVPDANVFAIAYPFGDYGQTDYTNTPQAVAVNREAMRKYFRLGFIQTESGLNPIETKPLELGRFEVPRHMTAEQLVRHLDRSDPWVQAKMLEAGLWSRYGQLGRAQAVYEELEKAGVSEPRLWAGKGMAMDKAGDAYEAQRLFAMADAKEFDAGAPDDRYRRLLDRSKKDHGPDVSTEFQGSTDSLDNNVSKLIVRAGAPIRSARVQAWASQERFQDRGGEGLGGAGVTGRGAGLRLQWFPVSKIELGADYGRRSYSEGVGRSADSYLANAAYQLIPQVRVGIRDSAGDVETSSAIRAGRRFRADGGGVVWDPALNWTVAGDYDVTRYNDSNRETRFRMQLTKRLSDMFFIGPSYQRSDSSLDTAEYYSPQGLSQYTGMIGINRGLGTRDLAGRSAAEATVRAEAGYGTERAGSRPVQSVTGTLSWRIFDRLAVSVEGQYSRSPTYISRYVGGGLRLIP